MSERRSPEERRGFSFSTSCLGRVGAVLIGDVGREYHQYMNIFGQRFDIAAVFIRLEDLTAYGTDLAPAEIGMVAVHGRVAVDEIDMTLKVPGLVREALKNEVPVIYVPMEYDIGLDALEGHGFNGVVHGQERGEQIVAATALAGRLTSGISVEMGYNEGDAKNYTLLPVSADPRPGANAAVATVDVRTLEPEGADLDQPARYKWHFGWRPRRPQAVR